MSQNNNVRSKLCPITFCLLTVLFSLTGCDEEEKKPTGSTPSVEASWNYHDAAPSDGLMYYQFIPPLAVVGSNDFWTCGYRNGTISNTNYEITHYTEGGWNSWIDTADGDFYAFNIECQPVSKDIWVTIKSVNSGMTGVCKYIEGLPTGFTKMHSMNDPGAIGFADQINLVAFSRRMNQPNAIVSLYAESTWTDYPCHNAAISSIITECDYSDPSSKTAYAINRTGQVLRFQNGSLTVESIGCELYDIYMTDTDSGWICSANGLYRKIAGGPWVKYSSYPGDRPYSIDAINDTVWILGLKDNEPIVHRIQDNTFYEETVSDIQKARLRMIPDQTAEPYKGYMMDDVRVLTRDVEQ